MNAADRKAVLEEVKATVESLGEWLRELADADGQETFDNLNDGLQASEHGQQLEANAELLTQASDEAADGNIAAALDAIESLGG